MKFKYVEDLHNEWFFPFIVAQGEWENDFGRMFQPNMSLEIDGKTTTDELAYDNNDEPYLLYSPTYKEEKEGKFTEIFDQMFLGYIESILHKLTDEIKELVYHKEYEKVMKLLGIKTVSLSYYIESMHECVYFTDYMFGRTKNEIINVFRMQGCNYVAKNTQTPICKYIGYLWNKDFIREHFTK